MLNNPVIAWGGALLVTLLFFYGLDHFIMNIQSLPLNIHNEMVGAAQEYCRYGTRSDCPDTGSNQVA